MSFQTFDRGNEVRESRGMIPEPIQQACSLFSDHKAHLSASGRVLVMEASARCDELASEFARIEASQGVRNDIQGLSGVDSQFTDCFTKNKAWYGMSAKSFCKEISGKETSLQASFLRAREELAKTGIRESLEESAVGMRQKRRRCLSEHDGDWEMDRKWDLAPFSSTKIASKEFPYIEVCWPMNMLGTASAGEIADFSSRCLALAELLETIGYRVALIGEDWNQGCLGTISLSGVQRAAGWEVKPPVVKQTFHRLTIRDAGSYGNIQDFAIYTSCEFYRRVMFSLIRSTIGYVHAVPGQIGEKGCFSFGSSLQARPTPARPGQLILDHETVEKLFQFRNSAAPSLFASRLQFAIKGTGDMAAIA